jgi:hypothetical protein
MYGFRQANWPRRLMRLSGAVPPISWLYARTLHHLDRLVYRLTRGRATFVFEGVTREVMARELEGEDRVREYARGIAIYPGWTQYGERLAPAHPGDRADPGRLGPQRTPASVPLGTGGQRRRAGASTIERLISPTRSVAASAGAGVSKMLRRPAVELFAGTGIYLREARTQKRGPSRATGSVGRTPSRPAANRSLQALKRRTSVEVHCALTFHPLRCANFSPVVGGEWPHTGRF